MTEREIDRMIVEKVLGLVPCDKWHDGLERGSGQYFAEKYCQHKQYACYPSDEHIADLQYGLPYYSTDIAAAWEVVEKMHDEQPLVKIQPLPFVRPVIWTCEMYGTGVVEASTAPMAICLAALKGRALI